MESCDHQHNPILASSPQEDPSWPIPLISSQPSSRQPLVYFPSLQMCLFLAFLINRIIQSVAFCDCLLSFTVRCSRCICAVACVRIFFLSGHAAFVYLSTRWWTSGLFPLLEYSESRCYGSCTRFCVDSYFTSLGVEMLGPLVTIWNIWRKCQTVFQSGYTIWHSHQHGMRVPVSS